MRFFLLALVPALCFHGVVSCAQSDPKVKSLNAPSWSQTIEVRDVSREGSTFPWNIVSATRIPSASPPMEGLQDFAHALNSSIASVTATKNHSTNSSAWGPLADSSYRKNEEGETVPAFWEALVPATYTIEFATPFVLHRIDLTPPLRKIGFSDFEAFVLGATETRYHPIRIQEATTSRGSTLESGYLWEFRIQPEKVRGVRLFFKKGTTDFPDRVFLKDLDLWGE